MPHSNLHKKKLPKNLIMLAIILGVMVLIFMITMVKMANAQDGPINGSVARYFLSLLP